MIRSFRNRGTEDLFNGVDSKAARKLCAEAAMKAARKRLVVLEAAKTLQDLKSPGYQLEKLKEDRVGQHGIRINEQYRVCFIWADHAAEQVEVTDYH
jgi:proteic killer suppression protein